MDESITIPCRIDACYQEGQWPFLVVLVSILCFLQTLHLITRNQQTLMIICPTTYANTL